MRALSGDYMSPGGKSLKVNGDVQKLRRCPAVMQSPLALKMVTSMQATSRKVPGTQEARLEMRHELTAYRVFYGQPIMITVRKRAN